MSCTFPNLRFLTDFVLNPRWLTYGVYTIMYSEKARAAHGKLSEADLVSILKTANPTIPTAMRSNILRTSAGYIASAMEAFRVAYRLGTGELVIPALLPPEQPDARFSARWRADLPLRFRRLPAAPYRVRADRRIFQGY